MLAQAAGVLNFQGTGGTEGGSKYGSPLGHNPRAEASLLSQIGTAVVGIAVGVWSAFSIGKAAAATYGAARAAFTEAFSAGAGAFRSFGGKIAYGIGRLLGNIAEAGPVPSIEPPPAGAPVPAAATVGRLKPVGGRINVGGGLEAGSETSSNLNPIVPGTGGPTKGIPNHVAAGFEEIGDVFEPGSAQVVLSNRLPYSTVDWTKAAVGSYRVLAPGGRVSLNVWTHSATEIETMVEAFRTAGFSNVQSLGSGPGTMIFAVR